MIGLHSDTVYVIVPDVEEVKALMNKILQDK